VTSGAAPPPEQAPLAAGADVVARLEVELRRVVQRLSTLAIARLEQPCPPWGSLAGAARGAAQALADAAQDVEEATAERPPVRRTLPDLSAGSAAAQVAVTGADLVAAAADLPAGVPVWLGADRVPVAVRLGRAVDVLVELRRVL
jgi:hypothetical protein